jgi:predicted RNase H-like nuclease (RuvC/YqgF family)
MNESTNESVTQPEVNSVQPEIKTETNSNVDGYKNDMFRYKQEAKELKAKLEAINLEKEQKNGNFESVISTLKDKVKEYQNEAAQLKSNFAENALDRAIENTAISKGLKGQQLDAFMRLIDRDAKGVVEFDEKFNVKSEDVTGLVDDHLKRYGDIFNRKVNVVDQSPNNNPINRDTNKFDKNKASADEIVAHLLANKDKLK